MIVPVGKSFVVLHSHNTVGSGIGSSGLPIWAKIIMFLILFCCSLAVGTLWVDVLRGIINYKSIDIDEFAGFCILTAFEIGILTLCVAVWFS